MNLHSKRPPAQQPGKHWAHINEVSFVAGMRLLFFVYRTIGRWPFRLMLYPVLLWYVAHNRAGRTSSIKYLAHLHKHHPTLATPVGVWGAFRHFFSFGESLLDKMLLWGGLFPMDKVVIRGGETITNAISSGRGGLMICAHLGNLELCRVVGRRHPKIKLTVLVHTKHAQAFNK